MVNAGVEHAHLDLNFTCSDCYLNSQFRSFPNAYTCHDTPSTWFCETKAGCLTWVCLKMSEKGFFIRTIIDCSKEQFL